MSSFINLQLHNIIHEVSPGVLSELHHLLVKMRGCKGEDCTHYHGKKYPTVPPTSPAVNTHLREGMEESHMTPLPTAPSNLQTSARSAVSPLTSESPSLVLVTRTDVTASSPQSVWNNVSKPTTIEKFTTLPPKDVNVNLLEHSTIQSILNSERKQQLMESLKTEHSIAQVSEMAPLPTVDFKTKSKPDETSDLESNSCLNCSRSDNLPKIFVRTSELNTSLSGLNVSSVPTTPASATPKSKEETSGMHFNISTPKPAKGKSPKRRKNGDREGRKKDKYASKGKPKNKSLKKSRKFKKKSSNGERTSLSEEKKESSENPTKQTVVLNTTIWSPESPLDNNSEKSDHEKPSQPTVTPSLGSNHVPTVLMKSSGPDTSSSKLNVSLIAATSASITTSRERITEKNVRQTTAVKPSKRKSAERRKNSSSIDRNKKKSLKKLRKMKKLSERENSQTSEEIKPTIEAGEVNQTGLKSKSINRRPESENKDSKRGNKALPEVSRKRSKKPANNRPANRNFKKKSKGKHSKQRPTQISQEGGVVENGTGFSSNSESSPSDPRKENN